MDVKNWIYKERKQTTKKYHLRPHKIRITREKFVLRNDTKWDIDIGVLLYGDKAKARKTSTPPKSRKIREIVAMVGGNGERKTSKKAERM